MRELPLYPFQLTGVSFLLTHPSALLADEPGLGKTLQTIAATKDDGGVRLVVCPKSLMLQWQSEISKWYPSKKIFLAYGDKNNRDNIYQLAKKHGDCYLITHYDLLVRDFDMLKVF